jgi:hypothetical protein
MFNASIAVAQAKPAHVAYAPMAVPSAYPLTSPPPRQLSAQSS